MGRAATAESSLSSAGFACQTRLCYRPVVEELSQRIRRMTDDLRAIQEELNRAAAADPQNSHLEGVVPLELLAEFRSVIDHMRTFLWAYMEAATRRACGSVDSTLQTARAQRAAEMLHQLREQLSAPNSIPVPEVRSLFAEINAIAHTAYDRHLPGASPEKK